MSGGMRLSVEEALKRGFIKEDDAQSIRRQSQESASARDRKNGGKARRRDIEHEEQVELVAEFRATYPQYAKLLIHIPNGGSLKGGKFEGWRRKQAGTRAGVSDLLLTVAKGGYHGYWMEFKAAPPNDAKVTDDQLEWLEEMREQGYKATLEKGVAGAMAAFKKYLSA